LGVIKRILLLRFGIRRRKKEEGRRKKEEGRTKKEEGRLDFRFSINSG
jgi:hypothetical protein